LDIEPHRSVFFEKNIVFQGPGSQFGKYTILTLRYYEISQTVTISQVNEIGKLQEDKKACLTKFRIRFSKQRIRWAYIIWS